MIPAEEGVAFHSRIGNCVGDIGVEFIVLLVEDNAVCLISFALIEDDVVNVDVVNAFEYELGGCLIIVAGESLNGCRESNGSAVVVPNAGEGVALDCRVVRSDSVDSILIGDSPVKEIALGALEYYRILDISEESMELNILSQSSGNIAVPVNECLALEGRSFLGGGSGAVIESLGEVDLSLSLIVIIGYGVTIDGKSTVDNKVIVVGHRRGDIAPCERMTCGDSVLRSRDCLAVLNLGRFIILAVDRPLNGVGLDGGGTVDLNVVSGHCSGLIGPTAESVAGGSGVSIIRYLCAVDRTGGRDNFAVDLPGYGVNVGAESAVDNEVLVVGHGLGLIEPAAEGRADRSIVIKVSNGLTEGLGGGADYLAVDLPCYGVGLGGGGAVDGDVACGHGLGLIGPTAEVVTGGGRILIVRDSVAELNSGLTDLLAVDIPCNGVGLSGSGAVNGDVACGHGCGLIGPTAELVAFGSIKRIVSNSVAELNGGLADLLAVDIPCYGVGLGGGDTVDGDIICGHGCGDLVPSEVIACFCGVFGSNDCVAEADRSGCKGHAVYGPCDRVGIGYIVAGNDEILVCGHSLGDISPLEGVAFLLNGSFGSSYSLAEGSLSLLIGALLAVDLPCHGVDDRGISTGDLNIRGRHGRGSRTPCEVITGLSVN